MLEPKNVHALTVELPAEAARFYNQAGEQAKGVVEGEHVHFEEKNRRYVMIAVPAAPLPKDQFIAEYERLEVLVNGRQRVRLADHPRLFSRNLDDADYIRGAPTFVPEEIFGDDFIGQAHDFELLRDGVRIFGPVRWLVPDERTGPTVAAVKGGPGIGEVTIELEKVDFRLMALVVYLDARFGDPVSVEQVLPDGQTEPLAIRTVGNDMVGDQEIFREAYLEGFSAGFARNLAVRLRFEQSGEGYFAAVGQTYTTYNGNRIIDVP
ncbi:MAG: hypothetical protein RQ826_07765 [Xanthomonadales bacterium]|nr:hypothetical protein [Xanthomonadales bacterium]